MDSSKEQNKFSQDDMLSLTDRLKAGHEFIKVDCNGHMYGICEKCKEEYKSTDFNDHEIIALLRSLIWQGRCVSCLRLADEIDENGHDKDCAYSKLLSIYVNI